MVAQILRDIRNIIALYDSDFITFAIQISLVTRKMSQLCWAFKNNFKVKNGILHDLFLCLGI